jgi:uncharacterized repeat protein (TIGR03943 family)
LRDRLADWQGVLLAAVLVGTTLWLGFSGRLALYIHPRYVEFTMVMAAVAAVFVVAATAFGWVRRRGGHGTHDAHDHDHDHDHDHNHNHNHNHEHDHEPGARPSARRFRSAVAAGSLAIAITAVIGLVIVPPATLSSAMAVDREMNAGAPVLDDDELISIGSDFSSFTVKDWASMLSQISSPEFFDGATVDVVGFVTPDASDPENVYFVSRFIVTCCAVDASPVGVPVYEPSWRDGLAENDWVHVTGALVANPSASHGPDVVVEPKTIEIVDEPSDPYVH